MDLNRFIPSAEEADFSIRSTISREKAYWYPANPAMRFVFLACVLYHGYPSVLSVNL
jgi:hypothetical protein